MTSTTPAADPATARSALASDEREELEALRLKVSTQQRLIDAMIEENADIHELRRRNHELEQYVGKLLGYAPVQLALKVRRRLLRRPDPPS